MRQDTCLELGALPTKDFLVVNSVQRKKFNAINFQQIRNISSQARAFPKLDQNDKGYQWGRRLKIEKPKLASSNICGQNFAGQSDNATKYWLICVRMFVFWEAMAGEQSLTVHWATKKASGGNNAKSVRIKKEICLRIQQTYCLKINKDLFAVKTKRGKMTNEQLTFRKQWHSPPVWYLVHEWPTQKDIFAMLREASWWQRHQKRQSTRTYNWKEWNAKILTRCLM